ncbi:MAG: CAP domain-containing protein [Oscillospiraceae bacterium]
MKYPGKLAAVILSAVIGCSATGVTCLGDYDTLSQTDSLALSDIASNVYSIKVGSQKKFTLKLSGINKVSAVNSDKSVAKITAISYKSGTLKLTVKGVSEGRAVISVYDKTTKKKVRTLTISVYGEASADNASSDNERPAITVDMGSTSTQINEAKKSPEEIKNRVLELINKERAANGIEPLALNDTLAEAAQLRADECASVYSHTRPDGRSCFTVLDDYGISYSCAGENIAYGYTSAEAVVRGWLDSSPHRKNILSEKYTETGIGYDPTTNSWTQIFIG